MATCICLTAVACIFCLFIIQTSAITPCTRSCTTVDKSLECWTQSLDHFADEGVHHIDRFARIVIQFAKWQQRSPSLAAENSDVIHKAVDRAINGYLDTAVLNQSQFSDVFDVIMKQTRHLVEEWEDKMPPGVACPIPCSYDSTTWRALFFFMLTITILTVFTLSVYVFCFLKPTKGSYVLTRQNPEM